jgi:hypothetical protein
VPIGGTVGGVIGSTRGGTMGQIVGEQIGCKSMLLWHIARTSPSTQRHTHSAVALVETARLPARANPKVTILRIANPDFDAQRFDSNRNSFHGAIRIAAGNAFGSVYFGISSQDSIVIEFSTCW